MVCGVSSCATWGHMGFAGGILSCKIGADVLEQTVSFRLVIG